MSVQVETLEKSMAKLKVTMPAEDIDKAMQAVYTRNRGKFQIPGFRKGHAPRKLIEQMYGKGVFFEDAINDLLPEAYEKAYKESGLDIVSRPEITFEEMEIGKDAVFTALVAVKPPVTLGEYKGLVAEKTDVTVTEEDVMKEIRHDQEMNSTLKTVEDQPAKLDDQVVIDYVGEMDGVPFDGGSDKGYHLTLGSHSFIEGFEDQLVGAKAGDQLDVNVTFPEEYHAAELAGKPAVFHVTVNEVKVREMPELNDDFASDVSEFETFEEYKADKEAKLKARKEEQAKTERENTLVEKAVENAQLEIPEAMLDTESRAMLEDFRQRLEMQGMNMDMYYQYTNKNEKSMLDEIRPGAEKQIRTRLVLEAVSAAEGIEASEEDVEKKLQEMADQYKMELEKVKSFMDEGSIDQLKNDIRMQKAIDLIVAESKEN